MGVYRRVLYRSTEKMYEEALIDFIKPKFMSCDIVNDTTPIQVKTIEQSQYRKLIKGNWFVVTFTGYYRNWPVHEWVKEEQSVDSKQDL